MSWAVVILALVTMQRIGELLLANSNTRRLLSRGAREAGSEHYVFIVALHAVWLAGLWWFAWDAPVSIVWLCLFFVLQLLRVWVISTLGQRWTTRIIVIPGEKRVRAGPYRIMNHPNYAVVIAEIAVLPLTFGLLDYAIVFSVLNGVILYVRIGAEARALDAAETGHRN